MILPISLVRRRAALVLSLLALLAVPACVGGDGSAGSGGTGGAGTGDGNVTGGDVTGGGTDAVVDTTTADTTTAGTDAGAETATPDGDTAGSDVTATETTPDDTGSGPDTTTPEDTAPAGCKADKDCPPASAACHVAACDVGTGKCGDKPVADGATCDDGNACTEGDVCAGGKCDGASKVCDDKNDCTDDSCDPAKGCANVANTAQCSDGDACTLADACKDAKCVPGASDKCDDGNPCTDDSCGVLDAAKGTKGCLHANNTAGCEDGSKCTTGDLCATGLCAAGTPTVCDDKNPCTSDSCDAKTGCANAPSADAAACDDANACTTGDACAAGKCTGKATDCDDKNPCTKDSCDLSTGCTASNNDAAPCNDDNTCTLDDKCTAGVCSGKGKVCEDDGNPCTDEKCANNTCSSVANGDPCDDGNPCTQKDVCKDKACGGGEDIKCDDKNPCTDDLCDKTTNGTCKFTNNTATCSDDSACTTKDVCQSGVCVGTPVVCDDGNQCTLDACDDATGKCASSPLADDTLCDDNSVCTQKDACKAGKCAGTNLNCDDGNPCTDDKCDAKVGCSSTANTAKCEDGNKCTVGDVCKDKVCAPSTTLDKCDDGNPCTADTCDAGLGCEHKNHSDNCDDKNPCTEGDVCSAGACQGTKPKVCDDGNLCTDDSCNTAKGCVATPNTAKCTDANVCTTEDACAAGACKGKPTVNCDDKNVCTVDSCDPKTGCAYKPAPAGGTCDDGNTCTASDKCDANGKCAGIGKNCDDNNPCTDDGCKDNVCSTTNNTKPCVDGDACTFGDFCDGKGACKGASALNCNDNNPCTDDSCDKITGCKVANNVALCDDGKFCTEKDACKDGKCQVSVAKDCGDGNGCTNDACDEVAKKCANAANAAPCDDGLKCTSPDVCKDAKCVAGPAKVCDDGNPCTADSCDPATANCKFALGVATSLCGEYKLPFQSNIDFSDPLWVNHGGTANVKWATDASPAAPGKLTGAASLNLNNGTTYGDGVQTIKATAYGKFLVDASGYSGAAMTLVFYSWVAVQEPGLDRCWVEVSSDGFATTAVSQQLPAGAAWQMQTVDVKAMIGKKFQIRFRFDTDDGIDNSGAGVFVDQLDVYGGPVVPITATSDWTEPFAANNNGWLFDPANSNGSVWAIDATPDIVSVNTTSTNKISLNVNNGSSFPGLVQQRATSPVINLTNAGSGSVTLLFKEYVDTESGFYDQRWVQASGDAQVTYPINVQLSSAGNHKNGWRWAWVDLTGIKGKKVRLSFYFDTKDSTDNDGKGWFIDDAQLSTQPPPVYGEMITCGNASAFTVANANAIGWGVNADAGTAYFSGDCSLNFNGLVNGAYNFTCPSGTSKVSGTAKTGTFNIKVPATGAKTFLSFKSYFDGETSSSYDKFWVTVQEVGGTNLKTDYFPVKSNLYKKWADVTFDISTFHGKNVQLIFQFDSGDCASNSGAGAFVDDIVVRADK
ncbi:MAG: hypothetical protein FJ100_03040 [Deltaproteobacteria bacterium]|nr:hypothetical protein [Deltaproteobacteria bacterium]